MMKRIVGGACAAARPHQKLGTQTSAYSITRSGLFISISSKADGTARARSRTILNLAQRDCSEFLFNHRSWRNYCSVSQTCWNCNNTLTRQRDGRPAQFFCDVCNAILPVNPNVNCFQTMQCEQKFDINTTQLSRTFKDLQKKLHPDKFSIMSKEEQNYSAVQSSQVNKAYSTLLKPLTRGLYLLELNGLTIEEGEAGIETEFLMEMMEINEELAETTDEETVRRIGRENAVKLESFMKDLSNAFVEEDYPKAREILMRLKYLSNIEDKVKEKLEKGFKERNF